MILNEITRNLLYLLFFRKDKQMEEKKLLLNKKYKYKTEIFLKHIQV